MQFRIQRSNALTIGVLIGVISLACGSDATTLVSSPVTESVSPTQADIASTPTQPANAAPTPTSTRTSVAIPTAWPYDSTAIMYRLFSEFTAPSPDMIAAMDEVVKQNDTSQVPVLVDTLRFHVFPEMREVTAAALRELTGQDISSDWNEWMEWLGKHRDEYRPPKGYVDWKVSILAQIDPRFKELFKDAEETSRIDLTEVTWGGVRVDGIPDLQSPKNIPAEEADYLGPDERVFGVSINGEHRAYPLRITNPHEMVNDMLGGEPISLMW